MQVNRDRLKPISNFVYLIFISQGVLEVRPEQYLILFTLVFAIIPQQGER